MLVNVNLEDTIIIKFKIYLKFSLYSFNIKTVLCLKKLEDVETKLRA